MHGIESFPSLSYLAIHKCINIELDTLMETSTSKDSDV